MSLAKLLEHDGNWGKRVSRLGMLWARPKPVIGTTETDVVHAENKWKLLRYRRTTPAKFDTPVLMIPSLINRHYVLDLAPGKSLTEYLLAEGHDVFVIDWGTPGPEDRSVSFDRYCDDYIGRALRKTAAFSSRNKAHLLGYCLGGTLAAMHAAVRPKHVASVATLAAPVRFDDDGLLAAWTNVRSFDIRALIDAVGNVPPWLLQAAFHMLRPTLSLAKAVHVLDRAHDDEFLEGFLALETWGNDNIPFPGAAFERYITELYQQNLLVKGEFRLSGQRVDLTRLAMPLLVVTFQHDNIVSEQSAKALFDVATATDKVHLDLHGGHVGAVVSRKAGGRLWPKLTEFWATRDQEPRATEGTNEYAVTPSRPAQA
ncbi:MAG: alpha/beta fold hydrolase [Proteobacteria bacterium]|nr:MAG: alpha/beta fold hydrolase [Pseudomonadota bacterium]